MNKLTVDDYRWIAGLVNNWEHDQKPIDLTHFYSASYVYDDTEVVAKERARSSKTNRHYTPEKTRNFEKSIREWGKREGMTPVLFPLSMTIFIFDKTGDPLRRKLGVCGLDYHTKNDMDNICKSIQDGLNGVLYKDDKQIVHLNVKRRYSFRQGFMLSVARAGLSRMEVKQLEKLL